MTEQMEAPTQALLVYVTAGDYDEARRLAERAVGARLAACANIHAPIESVYVWQGEVCRSAEHVVILKTTRERFAALEHALVEEHSYDCPCIVATELREGHAPFLHWIAEQTTPNAT